MAKSKSGLKNAPVKTENKSGKGRGNSPPKTKGGSSNVNKLK